MDRQTEKNYQKREEAHKSKQSPWGPDPRQFPWGPDSMPNLKRKIFHWHWDRKILCVLSDYNLDREPVARKFIAKGDIISS
jgi:hypothetical protein